MLWDVCEEHLDEAAFRWTQWERALDAPDFTLAEAAEWEERFRAHMDGLVAGGVDVEEKLLIPALEEEDPGRVFSAALALVESRQREEDVRWLVRGAAGHEQRAHIRRALELCEWKGTGEALLSLLKGDDVDVQASALVALVFREEAPDAVLSQFLTHPDSRLRIGALKGLRAPPPDFRTRLPLLLDSAHPAIRLAAIEAGLIWGARDAWIACRRALEFGNRDVLVTWALGCSEEELVPLLERLRIPEARADVLWALGFSGRVTAAEACLEYLVDERWARLAGEAFSAITGLSVAGRYCREKKSDQEDTPSEEEDLDADLVPRAEDFLPWPEPEAISTWWQQERGRFTKGTRYLMGHPMEGNLLLMALERGPMRRRHMLERELAFRTQGAYRIATRALVRRQRVGLEKARSECKKLRLLPLERILR